MEREMICQGRSIGPSELDWLNKQVEEHPDWSRHRITQKICTQWNWQTPSGHLKTFAARALIDKLEQGGHLRLPAVRTNYRRSPSPPYPQNFKAPLKHKISESLAHLAPLNISIPKINQHDDHCVGYYLKHYHYLGFNRTVGESMKYLVQDHQGRDLACLLFGSAAWRTAPRDQFIGWGNETRAQHLNLLTNNSRFLILPWIHVPNLASHILGLIARRIKTDWIKRYHHPIHMIETFVELPRFKGTCYKAANWQHVGKTKGRSRQDREHKLSVPVKDIWIYPLSSKFKQALCHED